MNAEDEEILTEIKKVILEINDLSRECPILVEGKKDVRSLRALGVEGRIMLISGSSLLEISEKLLYYKKAVILTDLDKKGREIANSISRYLRENGTVPLTTYREKLSKATRGKVQEIEGLLHFVRKIENRNKCGNYF
ncbi:MAG: toprim domain-containing protein [Candidatus Odinarchaeia archaeon]